MRRSDDAQQLRNELEQVTQGQGIKTKKGPVVDGGATTSVISGKDAMDAINVYELETPLRIKGVTGVASTNKRGDYKHGPVTMIDAPIVDSAQQSLVAERELVEQGCTVVTTMKAKL